MEVPWSKGVACQNSGESYFFSEICATMPSMREVGLKNGTFGGLSPKQRGYQNDFLTETAKAAE
jgi:hypothetical protein